MGFGRAALALLAGASLTPLLAVAASALEPRPLSLPDALALAERENPDLVAARLQRQVAEAGIRTAKLVPNPSLAVSASRDVPHQSATLTVPLEIGGRRHRRVEVASREVDLGEVAIAAVARRVRREVRDAYFEAALAKAFLAQREQALQLAARVTEIAQARFDAGDVPRLEVIQAQLEAARAQADLEVARLTERGASTGLSALLDQPADVVWEPVTPLEATEPALTLEEVTGRAAAANAELQRLEREQQVEESRHALLKAERIPNLDLELGADFDAPGEFDVGGRAGIGLELPLFARNQGAMAASEATIHMLAAQHAAARRAVEGQVTRVFYQWSARQLEVSLYRTSLLPDGRRLADLAEESYQVGRAGLLTVLDAQRNVQELERSYLESLLEMHRAFAELEETVGAALD